MSAESFLLDVGDGHAIHVATTGAAGGIPAVYLHGGPGSGCQPGHRRLFDPARLRAVFIDQRGAGRSRPHGRRVANTTAHLVADMERVRDHLDIDRWLVVGGSWGATLALAYAQTHPERVTGLVLRATFLGTRAEIDRAFGATLAQFYPALQADFLGLLPEAERDRPLDAYWRRILDPDPQVHTPAALAWHATERILSEIAPSADRLPEPGPPPARLPATPFMEAHYFSHGCFLPDDALMAGAERLSGIPGVLVQGRYDLLCPPLTAAALAARWPAAQLRVVPGAGHSLDHPAVIGEVRRAIDALARR